MPWRRHSLATFRARSGRNSAAPTASAWSHVSRSGPTDEYRVTITFACDPARTESLVKTAFELIEQFRSTGPNAGQVADERSALMRDFETNSQRNGYLRIGCCSSTEHHEDVADVFNMRTFYDRLTAPMLRDAARMYLDPRRYVEVTLLPEAK